LKKWRPTDQSKEQRAKDTHIGKGKVLKGKVDRNIGKKPDDKKKTFPEKCVEPWGKDDNRPEKDRDEGPAGGEKFKKNLGKKS